MTTREARIAKAAPVIAYLESDPEFYDILSVIAQLELTANATRADTEECAVCGKESLIHRYNDDGKNVCVGCSR